MPDATIRSTIANTIVTALVGAVLSTLLLILAWAWSGISDALVKRAAELVIGRLDFQVVTSEKQIQEVKKFGCKDSKLVAASCVGFNPNAQAAVGPEFNPDGTFNCYRYGPVVMEVRASAICMRVK